MPKTCQRSLKTRIFKRSLKDLWKIFKDLYMQNHLLRSSRIWPRSSKDPTKILIKILAKIFARILQDPQGLNKDLSKILKESFQGSFKDLSQDPQGFGQDLTRILVKIFARSVQGSLEILKDLMRIFQRS